MHAPHDTELSGRPVLQRSAVCGQRVELHYYSPAASPVHTSCRRMVTTSREVSQKIRTLPEG
jgi:hypothetical protein